MKVKITQLTNEEMCCVGESGGGEPSLTSERTILTHVKQKYDVKWMGIMFDPKYIYIYVFFSILFRRNFIHERWKTLINMLCIFHLIFSQDENATKIPTIKYSYFWWVMMEMVQKSWNGKSYPPSTSTTPNVTSWLLSQV